MLLLFFSLIYSKTYKKGCQLHAGERSTITNIIKFFTLSFSLFLFLCIFVFFFSVNFFLSISASSFFFLSLPIFLSQFDSISSLQWIVCPCSLCRIFGKSPVMKLNYCIITIIFVK